MCPRENKEYEVSKIEKIEKQVGDNNRQLEDNSKQLECINKWLEDTNGKLDILLARESSSVKTYV